ncbi:MAG: DUF2914 domain-containing protein [Gammaproteobacteria bacterium]|nr:DUF2914 domain-containing protein [Gammaproteobacteria bacterium]
MHEFAEEYVAKLEPRDERYFTRLGDDFFIATFPNGVKTWVYLYEVDGHTRRQTLGIYPEMSMQKALEVLYSARRAQAVDSDLATEGMDQSQVRMTEDSPINVTAKMPQLKVPRFGRQFLSGTMIGSGITLGLAALAAWSFFTFGSDGESTNTVATTPQQAMAKPTKIPARANTAAPQSRAASSELSQSRPAPDSSTTGTPTAAGENAAAASEQGIGAAQLALRQMQEELAGTLAVAQLTSGIVEGDPVDSLSWMIELGEKPMRIFYYVRVRGVSGTRLTYNWLFEGQLLKEDTVPVSKGWHSTAFSGITLTPQLVGEWRVEVLAADGTVLSTESFETRKKDGVQTLSRR